MKRRRWYHYLAWIFAVLYVLSPIDLVPGPIDDAILLIATAGFNWLVK